MDRSRFQLSNDTKIIKFDQILVHQIQNSYITNFAGSRFWVKVHVFCMAVAWLILIPVGIVSSRYARGVLKKKSVWFTIHVGANICGVILVAVGVAAIFLRKKIDQEDVTTAVKAKRGLGLATAGLTFLNPLIALVRPAATSRLRKIWFVAHSWTGLLAFTIAMATAATGYALIDAKFWIIVPALLFAGFNFFNFSKHFLLFLKYN